MFSHTVKNLPVMQKTRVQNLGWEGPLEKGVGTHFNVLACRNPWTEEPSRLQSMGSQRVRHNWETFTSLHLVNQLKIWRKNPGALIPDSVL